MAQDRAEAFNLSKHSYDLLHQMSFPGYLSQNVAHTMKAHEKVMKQIVAMVDEFTEVEAIKVFKELVGLKEETSGEGTEKSAG